MRALLELSRFSLGPPAFACVIIGLLTGIAAAFMGDLSGKASVWISLVLFVVVGGLMTPLMASSLNAAAGSRRHARQPSGPRQPSAVDSAELVRLLDAWNPVPLAVAGLGGFLIILWLMLAKPF